jgi:uncharacterized membrane protein
MTTLTVWRFPAPEGADAAVLRLEGLAERGLLTVEDAAVVVWAQGRRKPSARIVGSLTGAGELWGGSWGVLLALIFVVPIAGPVFGAGAGAIASSLSDFGIYEDFIMDVRHAVTPGTSALFVLSSGATADSLAGQLAGAAPVVVRCDLSPEQERRLFEALGEEPEVPQA